MAATPIKAVVLPVMYSEQRPMTAKELFSITEHPSLQNFKSGLSKLAERGFLTIDKSDKPFRYSLTNPRGIAHAKDPDLALKEARESRARILGLDVPEQSRVKVTVTVKRKPVNVTPPEPPEMVESESVKTPEPVKQPVRTLGTVEGKILDIMMQEGAITIDEVYHLAKEHESGAMTGYTIAKAHLLRMLDMNYAKLDFSTEPTMWYTTPEGEVFIQNQYAPEAIQ